MEAALQRQFIASVERFASDVDFDRLYPDDIRVLSKRHWTPLHTAREAAVFLSTAPGTKILDIGSGAGKFCLAAGYYHPGVSYYGIEQRKNLVKDAEAARALLALDNVSFMHGNFTQLKFRNYDHFYFYNSFYENIITSNRIDDSIEYSVELYNYYNRCLFRQLEQTPPGTRLATFHSLEDEVPSGFHLAGSSSGQLLKFWVRE